MLGEQQALNFTHWTKQEVADFFSTSRFSDSVTQAMLGTSPPIPIGFFLDSHIVTCIIPENEIEGRHLADLTSEDLKGMGIT